MMKCTMAPENHPPTLILFHFIKETPDFKKFIEDSIAMRHKKVNDMIGHPKGKQVFFHKAIKWVVDLAIHGQANIVKGLGMFIENWRNVRKSP